MSCVYSSAKRVLCSGLYLQFCKVCVTKLQTECKVSVCAFSFANSVSGFAISINNFRNCVIRITVRV